MRRVELGWASLGDQQREKGGVHYKDCTSSRKTVKQEYIGYEFWGHWGIGRDIYTSFTRPVIFWRLRVRVRARAREGSSKSLFSPLFPPPCPLSFGWMCREAPERSGHPRPTLLSPPLIHSSFLLLGEGRRHAGVKRQKKRERKDRPSRVHGAKMYVSFFVRQGEGLQEVDPGGGSLRPYI